MKTKNSLLVAFCLLVVAVACKSGKEEEPIYQDGKGRIVGYVKQYDFIDDNGETHYIFGLFIVTDTQDSLLSFNTEPTSIGLDPDGKWYLGFHSFSGCRHMSFDGTIKVRFKYRNAVESEMIETHSIVRPSTSTDCLDLEKANFKQQVIIKNIERTK